MEEHKLGLVEEGESGVTLHSPICGELREVLVQPDQEFEAGQAMVRVTTNQGLTFIIDSPVGGRVVKVLLPAPGPFTMNSVNVTPSMPIAVIGPSKTSKAKDASDIDVAIANAKCPLN